MTCFSCIPFEDSSAAVKFGVARPAPIARLGRLEHGRHYEKKGKAAETITEPKECEDIKERLGAGTGTSSGTGSGKCRREVEPDEAAAPILIRTCRSTHGQGVHRPSARWINILRGGSLGEPTNAPGDSLTRRLGVSFRMPNHLKLFAFSSASLIRSTAEGLHARWQQSTQPMRREYAGPQEATRRAERRTNGQQGP